MEPVLCPVAPELVVYLRKPGGMINRGPTQVWLDESNVLHVKAISDAEAERLTRDVTDNAEYVATGMTVGKLRELLAEYADDLPVVLQKDAEGNGFSPLDGGDEAMYVAETTWCGAVYMTDAQVDADPRYGDEDRPPESAIRVVVLWPVN